MGGFQGALQGLQAGNDIKRKDLLAQQQQQKLTRDMESRQLLQDTLARQQQAGDMHPVSIANALIATGHPELANQGFGLLKDFRSKVKTTQPVLKDGQEFTQPIFDDGSYGEVNSLPRPVRPMQVNQGSQVSFIDPNSLQQRGAVGVGMSPEGAAGLNQRAQQFAQSHGLAQQNSAMQAHKLMMELDPTYQAQKASAIAGGKEQGVNQVKASADLPKVVEQGEQTIKLVDDLLNHPGFKLSVGKSAPIGSATSYIPGTDAASFDIALTQLKGKQFLEAFESLKGGGAITEIEGQKAQQAMSRMDKANTEEEFTKASHEFQGIIRQGIGRAKTKAGVSNQPMQPRQNSGASGSFGDNNGYSARRLD